MLILYSSSASIAVWIIYQLAAHPEYIPLIRDEMHALVDVPSSSSTPSSLDSTEHSCTITYDALQRATVLDSFIREVMRTKGDTLSTARMTTRDVAIAGYTIPRGECMRICRVCGSSWDGVYASALPSEKRG
jgi:cytochrome P450